MILLRLTAMTAETIVFAKRLEAESGHEICCIVDERTRVVDTQPFQKISLTAESCQELGLHTPPDFGWRCGDYGFYLARKRFPAESHLWMIEYDVRITGHNLKDFFAKFDAEPSYDLIAGDYRPVTDWWYWSHTMVAKGQPVYRCLFPVVRLSARAIDLLLAQRIRYARYRARLANWPNDESFVATVLTQAGMKCADLNEFGTALWDDHTFSFAKPFDGDTLDTDISSIRVYHPVLYGNDLSRKLERMKVIAASESYYERQKRRFIKLVNSRTPAPEA